MVGMDQSNVWSERLTEAQLKTGSNEAIITAIAQFAVANGFARVQCAEPFHLRTLGQLVWD